MTHCTRVSICNWHDLPLHVVHSHVYYLSSIFFKILVVTHSVIDFTTHECISMLTYARGTDSATGVLRSDNSGLIKRASPEQATGMLNVYALRRKVLKTPWPGEQGGKERFHKVFVYIKVFTLFVCLM